MTNYQPRKKSTREAVEDAINKSKEAFLEDAYSDFDFGKEIDKRSRKPSPCGTFENSKCHDHPAHL
jgi:hypothetical protein